MGAKTEKLISLEVVTDHDCGNYSIGEVDVISSPSRLDLFFKSYGRKGFEEISTAIVFLNERILDAYRDSQKRVDSSTDLNVVLTTENGLPSDPSNEIALKDVVRSNLVRYARRSAIQSCSLCKNSYANT